MTDSSPSVASLRLLVLVDDLGGVGAAARALGCSQPRASRMIAALEEQVGARLVDRGRMGSTLTEAGTALLGPARRVIGAYRRLEEQVRALDAGRPAPLSLATSRTIGEQLVPRWTRALSESSALAELSFRVDNSRTVMALVASGAALMGFVEGPEPPEGFAVDVFAHDPLVLIVPPGHPWAAASPPLAEVRRTRMVEREPGSGVRALLDVHLPERPTPVAEFDSNTAILHAVAAGAGPAFLSRLAVHERVRAGAVVAVEVAGLTLERPLCAIWVEDTVPAPVVAAMLAIVHATPPAPGTPG